MIRKMRMMARITMRKAIAALACLMALCAANPMGALAADQTVGPVDGEGACEVAASATVTDQDLEDLGLSVVVSLPTEVTLTLDAASKAFKGSGSIYAYGVMDSGRELAVAIDAGNAAYGKVKYRVGAGEPTSDPTDNFHASVTEKLAKVTNSVEAERSVEASFTASETLECYMDRTKDRAITTYARLYVDIGGLIPASGKGTYFTNVPIKISIR